MDFLPSKTNIAEERLYRVGMTGNATSTPTRRAGPGVTVTRTGVGVWRFSFNDNPGTFVGITGFAFRADTASGVKGYSLSAGAYVAPSGSTDGYIDVSLWDSSNAAVDLTTTQYLDITFEFSTKRVIS